MSTLAVSDLKRQYIQMIKANSLSEHLPPHTAKNLCPKGDDSCPISEYIITLQKELELLKQQAIIDDLSGLYNRRHLMSSLQQEMERSIRTKYPITFIMLDIDYFKTINDTYGHPVGDLAIQSIAQIIQQNIRKIDIPCRYGGEEFAIILPSTPTLLGIQVAERIRHNIEKYTLDIPNKTAPKMTASFGIHTYLGQDIYFTHADVDTFIAETDSQLYKAKRNGRNRVCAFEPKMTTGYKVTTNEKNALLSDP